jgi:TatD DNase family protein
VSAFACIGVGSLSLSRQAVQLSERCLDVVATVGVHPHDASTWDEALAAELAQLATHPRVVAVGEVGLDFHYDHSPRDVQRDVFRRAVGLAKHIAKPIVVHTREAPEETIAILREEGARDVGGIIHCFSEERSFARSALELGFFLSFSGILTFKNARGVHDVAAWAPADRILVETDSPYRAPVPVRGKKCEPSLVVHTAARLAELRREPAERVAERTTQNALAAFRLNARVDGRGLALDTGLAARP